MEKKDLHKEIYSFHVRKAMDYTRNNYKTPLNLDEVAKYLGLNKCYFCNLFKRNWKNLF